MEGNRGVHGATSVEGPVGYFQATNCLPLYVSGFCDVSEFCLVFFEDIK